MMNVVLSSRFMPASPRDIAQLRLDNAMVLFEEFVRATARHADAATLRGLERRFAERLQIQPSYWSQIKSRSRQIGERLARQFEQLCHKPSGWMDQPHGEAAPSTTPAGAVAPATTVGVQPPASENLPRDDDERFIVGLVLTYYRRHPTRARTRLLDLLGEVLTPPAFGAGPSTPAASAAATSQPPRKPALDDAHTLWLRSQGGVAPLKRKR